MRCWAIKGLKKALFIAIILIQIIPKPSLGGIVNFTLALDQKLPAFQLAGTDGQIHTPERFANQKAVVIFFTCNHCPYVTGSDEITRATCQRFSPQEVSFIAINSNSSETIPEDSFAKMVERMQINNFPWTYLFDETQSVAKSFGALRTPHFFLFDHKRALRYCGRAVDSPRDSTRIKVRDLESALEDLLADRPVRTPLTNPIGCNIKWKGRDPHWMPQEACDLV